MGRQIPKNVRQIGNVSDSSKIYIEDYVDTFFNQLCEKADQGMVGAFLVGEKVQEEDQDYIYVYGAIQMQELGIKGKDFVIEDEVWKKACETCKEYFSDGEILGWFIGGGEMALEVNHNINKIHQKYFSREKSIFVTKNTRDREEKFYIYKYRNMMECGGHYIYYEKNVEMQNYMIASRKKVGLTPSEIIDDRVIKSFRSIIQEKNEKTERKNHSRLVYALSTFLVLLIVGIGVTTMNDYEKIQKVQDSLNQLSESATIDEENKKEDADKTVEASGNVTGVKEEDKDEIVDKPIEQEQQDQQNQQEQQEEVDAPVTNETEVYIVKKGDTLASISKQTYGDTSYVGKICEINGLEDGNLIIIGQKLLLP